jgi:hypothetical protein
MRYQLFRIDKTSFETRYTRRPRVFVSVDEANLDLKSLVSTLKVHKIEHIPQQVTSA